MMGNFTRSGLLAVLAGLASASGLSVTSTLAQATVAVDTSSPVELIRSSSAAMLSDLDANRAKYQTDRSGLYRVVDEVMLPNFDVTFAAQQVLGRHWRTATPEQRDRFVKAFYRSLLTSYGDALLDFTGDRLKILPFQGDAAADRATVRSEIRRDNGAMVAVNYSLRRGPAGWKAWDVVIEGISYVKSFREDFGLEIDQKGLEPLIRRLEAQAAAGKPTANR